MEKYVQKIESINFSEILWNIPEQKTGVFNIIGGNAQSFRTEVKTAEFLVSKYPLKSVNLILPDALKASLPQLENAIFLESTESGSLAGKEGLVKSINAADFNILLGDFSKNSITSKIVASAGEIAEKPLLITRDAVDLLAENSNIMEILAHDNVIFVASMMQMQKIFRAAYYPRMILLSQPITQITETFHKFTLSYPAYIVTLFNGNIVIAQDGKVSLIPLEKSVYTPITFWGGELAGKIATLSYYNPGNFMKAVATAVLQ